MSPSVSVIVTTEVKVVLESRRGESGMTRVSGRLPDTSTFTTNAPRPPTGPSDVKTVRGSTPTNDDLSPDAKLLSSHVETGRRLFSFVFWGQ